ncbi:MAG: class I SAM-dependent methyltransferase [Bacteroidota bacterium]
MSQKYEEHIIASWNQNAGAWITAIQKEEIASRIAVTNQIIIDTVLEQKPKKVLDLGCGEGWLTRALVASGLDVLGVDVVPELVDAASSHGIGRFQVVSYEGLADGALAEKFDLIVCNFSLFGEESVKQLFGCLHELLLPNGRIVIQTLHPHAKFIGQEYKDAWRQGSWQGFNSQFTNPAPWYFRTLETWKRLFQENQIDLSDTIEPINPATQDYASIVFVGKIY